MPSTLEESRGTSSRGLDLLRIPGLGAFLSWVHARTVLQTGTLLLAALLVLDGLFGSPLTPRNLAGVLPWVHWRGFVVLALLVAGNLFCMACPFMLPRRLAKRVLPADRPWPRALRSKWLALGLLLLFFWAYEAFDLWQSPWLTAWIAVTYFAGAFVVDGFFRGAAFCKHVCPIGQFHFVHSTLSPFEVRVRDAQVCAGCRTKDCIRGRPAAPAEEPARPLTMDGVTGEVRLAPPSDPTPVGGRNGCELWLFQERKSGNLDCTFCLDCIHACPHDNVGIVARSPGRELVEDPWRSGIGRLTQRPDIAALAAGLTFAAFVNAFGMVRPVRRVLDGISGALGSPPEPVTLLVFFVVGLLVLPALALAGAAAAEGRIAGGEEPLVRTATRQAYALVPLGLGMWTAHYLFHFLVGARTVVPIASGHLATLGLPFPGGGGGGTGPLVPESWLLPMQILLLQAGLLGTLWVSVRIARREHGRTAIARKAAAPWAAIAIGLFAAGVWLLLQPMEMRGTPMMMNG